MTDLVNGTRMNRITLDDYEEQKPIIPKLTTGGKCQFCIIVMLTELV